jgi:hypothetical protein
MKNRTTILSIKGLVVILLFVSNTVAAQSEKPNLIENKMFNNAIYGSVGYGLVYVDATVYYERMFNRNAQESISTFVKVGYGVIGVGVPGFEGGPGNYILGQFGILTGVRKHHLEVSAGLTKYYGDVDISIPWSVSIGYRFQKPGGNFIFRTGVGWIEGIYAGLGTSF